MMKLINTRTGRTFLNNLSIKSSFWGRLVGYLFVPESENKNGMLLLTTKRVHTFGMSHPLDLYFLDRSFKLIDIQRDLKPNRISASPKGCAHILEISHKVTQTDNLKPGDRLSIEIRLLK
jgi:uncharacterized membrane protein (UPF0127 family)